MSERDTDYDHDSMCNVLYEIGFDVTYDPNRDEEEIVAECYSCALVKRVAKNTRYDVAEKLSYKLESLIVGTAQ